MKSIGQLQESIERFRRSFWEKSSSDRPPVGVVPQEIWTPIKYLRRPFAKATIEPRDIGASLAADDYEFAFAKKAVSCDDFIPFSAPWRAIPWLEAMCGCQVRYATGSFAPEAVVSSIAELCGAPIPARKDWLDCMQEQVGELTDVLPGDCWLSATILRGPSDVLAAMRGISEFCCDLIDEPAALDEAAGRVNRLLMDVLDKHFSLVEPKMGGYGHIFGYWAPEKTVVIQEDAMGLCSPAHYRDIFLKYNAEVVKHFGSYVLFHLHSTGFKHYRDVLGIPALAGIQITVERNGPSLVDMLSDLKVILEQSRLILYVEHYFEQLPQVISRLPKAGLYVIVPDSLIATDRQFTDCVHRLCGE